MTTDRHCRVDSIDSWPSCDQVTIVCGRKIKGLSKCQALAHTLRVSSIAWVLARSKSAANMSPRIGRLNGQTFLATLKLGWPARRSERNRQGRRIPRFDERHAKNLK